MSNDVIKSIQNLPVSVELGLDDDTRAVAGAGGSKRISIKGGVFRKMAGGKEIARIEDRHMNVIFVKMAHSAARQYYTGAYKEGVNTSPTCWSSDGKAPDEGVKTPAAASCDKCPHSVRGSGQGGTGTACRLSWRTAVVLPNDPSGDVMQLVLPATSVFGDGPGDGRYPFKAYIRYLANNNVSAGRVITKMQFDTNSPVPKLLFSAAAPTPTEDLATIKSQGLSMAAVNAVKLTVFQQDEGEAPAQPEEVAAPVQSEPTLRKDESAAAAQPADVSAVLQKWGSKKK